MAENISTVNAEGAIVDNPKLEQVFSSIEKQLIAQTGFLKSMQSLQSSQFKFSKDMAKKTQSEKSRELVSQEDGSNLREARSIDSDSPKDKGADLGNGISGLLSSALSALGGLTLGGLIGGILSKSLPAILAPIIGSFIKGAVEQTLKNFGADASTAAVIGDAAKTGVTWGIWGRLLFGKWGGLAGLLAGVGSHLGTIMDKNQDGIVDGILGEINSDPEWWNTWGALLAPAVAGLLYLLAKKIGVKLLAAAGVAAAAAMGGKTPPVPPGAPGAPGSPAPGGPGPATGAPGPGGPQKGTPPTTAPDKGKPLFKMTPGQFEVPGLNDRPKGNVPYSTLPSGANVKGDGRVGPQNIQDIVEELKHRDAGKFAKYARFFKFAGPAVSVIPSLIEPAMAIYNGESDDEIKKKVGIALGSVSGAVLGGLLAAAGMTAIPIVGQSGIANLGAGMLGAGVGALTGSYIAEKITDVLMGGASTETAQPDPSFDANMMTIPGSDMGTGGPAMNGSRGLAMLTPPTAPRIAPAESMPNRASAVAGLSTATTGGGAGGGVKVSNNMGGNVNNNTNVGGSSTTYNIFQSSGSGALSNSLPVPMAG